MKRATLVVTILALLLGGVKQVKAGLITTYSNGSTFTTGLDLPAFARWIALYHSKSRLGLAAAFRREITTADSRRS